MADATSVKNFLFSSVVGWRLKIGIWFFSVIPRSESASDEESFEGAACDFETDRQKIEVSLFERFLSPRFAKNGSG
ncbi:MAG: hypothetical protein A3C90_02940 [Candidatus Magasanikbacteria bacterium RIFCSPHIGHO2_02_FULL_51_14]|uniref:Uncharacterized protein n=1 Tax=Candidatus Magasanikbacteria bacterium RIFCSPHIGHO2_02_FULL_51_14 TaxID=1798683 RepID=A0A1F6MQA2_9BACT|nr:MAG: hypothetical protein A3C90_02940 [Candidatus Magasanikbacteria bacterium RIFCSPHIGHO2_02_FULL_51_14]